MSKKTYLERYLAGEYEQVWKELVKLGDAVHKEPLSINAFAVARETMRRAAHNVRIIAERLKATTYEFEYPEDVCKPLHPDAEKFIDTIEQHIGIVPLSLRAWWMESGLVSFVPEEGSDTSKKFKGSDPLMLFDAEEIACTAEDNEVIYIGWDSAAKDWYSGGENYLMPGPGMDGLITNTRYSLVEYLRESIIWGGFPGFQLYGKRDYLPPAEKIPHDLIAALTQDLLPF